MFISNRCHLPPFYVLKFCEAKIKKFSKIDGRNFVLRN